MRWCCLLLLASLISAALISVGAAQPPTRTKDKTKNQKKDPPPKSGAVDDRQAKIPLDNEPSAAEVTLKLRSQSKQSALEIRYLTLGPVDQLEQRKRIGPAFFQSLNAANQKAMAELNERGGQMSDGIFSPDGKFLVLANSNAPWVVKVWDIASGKLAHVLRGHTAQIKAFAYSPDGKYIATAGDDKVVRLWDPTTGTEAAKLTGHTLPIRCLAFDPTGKMLASGARGGTRMTGAAIHLWNVDKKVEEKILYGPRDGIHDMAFSPDGKHLVVAVANKPPYVWNLATYTQTNVFTANKNDHDLKISFLPNSQRVVTVGFHADPDTFSKSGYVQVRDLSTGQMVATKAFDRVADGLYVSENGKMILVQTFNDPAGGNILLDVADKK